MEEDWATEQVPPLSPKVQHFLIALGALYNIPR